MKLVYRFARAATALALIAGTAKGAPDAGPLDGGRSCNTSSDCGRPTVHCHPARHECVECLTDRNCAGGLVCDENAGVCAPCGTDADCSPDLPYCSAGACIMCRTDANCGPGVACVDGTCGSCGDGVCHRSERLFDRPFVGESKACPEDCASQCPDQEMALDETRTFRLTRDLISMNCGFQNESMNDVTVTFTAPKESLYNLVVRPDVADAFVGISSFASCGDDQGGGCFSSTGRPVSYVFYVEEGQSVVLVVESTTAQSLEVTLKEFAPICDTPDCSPIEPVDSGKPNTEQTAQCLAGATDRGDPSCAGVTCACTECPGAYDDCGTEAGCAEVLECMQENRCTGVDCYTTGVCRRAIDARGGVSGEAFRAAAALQSCALSHLCALPCDLADASAPPPPPPDPGALCAPGRRVACECSDGKSGVKRCSDGGDGFGECDCSPPPPAPQESSCDCNVGRRTGPGAAGAVMLGLAAALAGLRGRSRHASRRRR